MMQQHSIYTTFFETCKQNNLNFLKQKNVYLNTGSAIQALRTQRGISRAEMCHKMGLDVPALMDYETGTEPCPEILVERIEHWLDVSIMSYHFSYVTFTDRRK